MVAAKSVTRERQTKARGYIAAQLIRPQPRPSRGRGPVAHCLRGGASPQGPPKLEDGSCDFQQGFELDPHLLDRHRVSSGTKNPEISPRDFPSLFVQIFARDVVFGHLTGANLLPIAFSGVFDARYDPCLERVSLFQQLVNTFRIDTFNVGQALQVSRLQSRRLRAEVGRTRLAALAPALPVNPDLGLLTRCFRQRFFLCCGFLRNGFPLRQLF